MNQTRQNKKIELSSSIPKKFYFNADVGHKLTAGTVGGKSKEFRSFLRFKSKKSKPSSPEGTPKQASSPQISMNIIPNVKDSSSVNPQFGRLFSSIQKGNFAGKLRSRLSKSGNIDISIPRTEKPLRGPETQTGSLLEKKISIPIRSKSQSQIFLSKNEPIIDLSNKVSNKAINDLHSKLKQGLRRPQQRMMSAGEEVASNEFVRSIMEKSLDSKFSRAGSKSVTREIKEVQSQTYYMRNLEYQMRCDSKSAYSLKVRSHLEENFKAVKEALKLRKPTNETLSLIQLRCPPPKKGNYTVVFDLDETLVHIVTSPKDPESVLTVYVKLPDGNRAKVSVYVRPFFKDTIKKLKETCEIVVWTAGKSEFANCILTAIDPDNELFDLRLFRDQCYSTSSGQYIKDLRILNRSLDKCIIVDNSAGSYCFQLDNGVPILPFLGEKNDTELLLLGEYLSHLTSMPDFREFNRKHLRLRDFEKANSLGELKIRLLKKKSS